MTSTRLTGTTFNAAHLASGVKQEASREAFKVEFDAMSNAEKGAWGERAMLKEIDERDQVLLSEHHDQPHAPGFDVVSFDPIERRLHIWEAKNWGSNVSEKDLTAWSTEHAKKNWSEVIESLPDGPARAAVKEAINEGRTSFHLRLGPEAGVSKNLAEKLDDVTLPWATFDWGRLSQEK